MARIALDTLNTALTILAEWNHGSASPVDVSKPDGAKLLRDAISDAKALERLSRSIGRRAEYACNFPMTEAEKARADQGDARDAEKAATILKAWRLSASIADGDPRGCAIKIKTPKTGAFNGMGGAADGWNV